MSRQFPLQPCGTNAAYQRHVRHREVPCGPCTRAMHDHEATRWERAHPPPPPWLDDLWELIDVLNQAMREAP